MSSPASQIKSAFPDKSDHFITLKIIERAVAPEGRKGAEEAASGDGTVETGAREGGIEALESLRRTGGGKNEE